MIPIFDATKLTDDEIQSRLEKCYMNLGRQIDLGHNTMVDSIRSMIQTLELERERRRMNEFYEEMKKDPKFDSSIELGDIEGLEKLIEKTKEREK